MSLFDIYKIAIDTYFSKIEPNQNITNFINFQNFFFEELENNEYTCIADENFGGMRFGSTYVPQANIFAATISLNSTETYIIIMGYTRWSDGLPTGILSNFTEVLSKRAPNNNMRKAFFGLNISNKEPLINIEYWGTYTSLNDIYPNNRAITRWWTNLDEETKTSCKFYIRHYEELNNNYHIILLCYLNNQYELQDEARKLLTFSFESCGESTIPIKGPKHMKRIHGKVVNELYNILSDEYGERNLYNNQLIDLAVTEDGNLIKIFEVKTKNDSQSIYTGIGQLLFHSGANSEVEKILLLPQSDDGYEELYDLFDEMGIWIAEYTIDEDEDVTFWELRD